MPFFIVLWPYLLTTKLRSMISHNLGHSNQGGTVEIEDVGEDLDSDFGMKI